MSMTWKIFFIVHQSLYLDMSWRNQVIRGCSILRCSTGWDYLRARSWQVIVCCIGISQCMVYHDAGDNITFDIDCSTDGIEYAVDG